MILEHGRELCVGDRVKLKGDSNSPIMTIVGASGPNVLVCGWFERTAAQCTSELGETWTMFGSRWEAIQVATVCLELFMASGNSGSKLIS